MAAFADMHESIDRIVASFAEAEVERMRLVRRIDELESELHGLRQTQSIIDAEVERIFGQ